MELLKYTTTETLIYPDWETLVVPVSQPGTPGRDKRGVLLSRVWQPGQNGWYHQPGQKVLPAPRGWRTLLSRLVLGLFFPSFLFSILFLFQLYFYISIKLIYWNSVCMISTGATPSSCWSHILLKNIFIFHKIINSYRYNVNIIYYYNYNDQINNSCK